MTKLGEMEFQLSGYLHVPYSANDDTLLNLLDIAGKARLVVFYRDREQAKFEVTAKILRALTQGDAAASWHKYLKQHLQEMFAPVSTNEEQPAPAEE